MPQNSVLTGHLADLGGLNFVFDATLLRSTRHFSRLDELGPFFEVSYPVFPSGGQAQITHKLSPSIRPLQFHKAESVSLP